ncbi:MAG TPA: hypothetical protein VK204_09415 [Nocardioidaceae bacterium]|nr:hypothetical protein [Nocardioidaceae bacterium]
MQWWRVKVVANAVNGSTLLGLGIARVGRARLTGGPRGLVLATGYRNSFPRAGAFTVGNVVLTRHDPAWLSQREQVLVHEERHSWQFAVTLGLPMLPLYVAAAGWSYLRGGDFSTYNVFEVRAGLEDGGYPLVSRRQRLRREQTA